MMHDYGLGCNSCEHYDAMESICLLDGKHKYSDHSCDVFELGKDIIRWQKASEIVAEKVKLARWTQACGKKEEK